MLELHALEFEQRRTSVSKLCNQGSVPSTTALFWLDKLRAEAMTTGLADARRL
jgi:hypothetical protein